MITNILYNGIDNKLYRIVDLINLHKLTNIPYYLVDSIRNDSFKDIFSELYDVLKS